MQLTDYAALLILFTDIIELLLDIVLRFVKSCFRHLAKYIIVFFLNYV